jgi:hypothetical protein
MKERLMAVQLFHELIHARLILERQKEWPPKHKTMHDAFEKWSSYASTPQAAANVAAFKAQLQDLIGFTGAKQKLADAFEHLLHEKFAIQKAFGAFGVQASNAEIAHYYVAKAYSMKAVAESMRTLRDRKADAAAAKLVDLYNELDKFNAAAPKPSVPAPSAPLPHVPAPVPPKGTELLKEHWKSAFASTTPVFPRAMSQPFARATNTFRPTPVPVGPPRFAQWQPPVLKPPPLASYSPARPFANAFGNRFPPTAIPRTPGFDPFRGPIRSTASAPPWATSRPDHFTPGPGSGWNPDRFSFGGGRIDPPSVTRMDLLGVRSQPQYERPIPGFSGRRDIFPQGWDLGSRD